MAVTGFVVVDTLFWLSIPLGELNWVAGRGGGLDWHPASAKLVNSDPASDSKGFLPIIVLSPELEIRFRDGMPWGGPPARALRTTVRLKRGDHSEPGGWGQDECRLVPRQVLILGWHRHSCLCPHRQECLCHPNS